MFEGCRVVSKMVSEHDSQACSFRKVVRSYRSKEKSCRGVEPWILSKDVVLAVQYKVYLVK